LRHMMVTHSPHFPKGMKARQSIAKSTLEQAVRQVTFLFIAGGFAMWWIPNEAPSFWMGVYKSFPFTVLAFFWGLTIRRIFTRL